MQKHHVVGPCLDQHKPSVQTSRGRGKSSSDPNFSSPTKAVEPACTPLFPIHNCSKQPHPIPQKASLPVPAAGAVTEGEACSGFCQGRAVGVAPSRPDTQLWPFLL